MKRLILLALGLMALGCGGSNYAYEESPARQVSAASGGESAPSMEEDYEPTTAAMSPEDTGGAGGGGWDAGYFEDESGVPASGAVSDVLNERPRLAQNLPTPTPQQSGQGEQSEQAETSDGIDLSGPLLIYTARFHLGVYEVTRSRSVSRSATSRASARRPIIGLSSSRSSRVSSSCPGFPKAPRRAAPSRSFNTRSPYRSGPDSHSTKALTPRASSKSARDFRSANGSPSSSLPTR